LGQLTPREVLPLLLLTIRANYATLVRFQSQAIDTKVHEPASGYVSEFILYSELMEDRRRSTSGISTERRSNNRRAFPRWPAEFEIAFGAGKEMISAHAVEIGEGGLSFYSDHAIAMDSELKIEYRLDTGDWVKLRAVVRHVKDGKIGVEFLNLRLSDRLKILDFISATK
jgi:hypothetical protein